MRLETSIPVLRVQDYERAKAFWTDTMGFAVAEEGGEPPRFGIFKRDAATVFVDAWHGGEAAPSPSWRAYFHVEDIEAFVATLDGPEIQGPVTKPYGMREVEIRDPEGNLLCFGQDV